MDNPYNSRYPNGGGNDLNAVRARKSSLELICWEESGLAAEKDASPLSEKNPNPFSEKNTQSLPPPFVPSYQPQPQDAMPPLPVQVAAANTLPALSTISPYIGLRAKLSRAWATHTVVLLFLTAVMFIFNALEAHEKANSAIQRIHDGCMNVQSATDTVVNLPRTLAVATVSGTQKATQSIIDITGRSLTSLLSALEDLIVWVIKMYFGTTLCIAEVLIHAALSIVADAGKILTDLANKTVNTLLGSLQKAGVGLANIADSAANTLGGILGSLTGKDAPHVDLANEIASKNLTISIPDSWVNSIKDLSSKIPSEDEIFGNLTSILDKPFGKLKSAITDSFSNAHINITGKVDFPKKISIEMCDGSLGKDTINGLAHAVATIMYIAAGVLIAVALALTISQMMLVVRQHMGFRRRLAQFRQDLVDYMPFRDSLQRLSQPATRAEMDLFMLPGNSVLNMVTRYVNSRFGGSDRVSIWRWYFHYIWHPPSLACFAAGFLGLLCIGAQIHAINGLRGKYVPRLAEDINKFQYDYLGGKILGKVHNDSVILAEKINHGIADVEEGLNHTLFSPVDSGTKDLNQTLDTVVAGYIDIIRKIFKNTPLDEPVEGLVNCTVTKNIRTIQKVLTFVDNHMGGVSIPRVGNDILTDPAKEALKPVNMTANALKKLAVGKYIPNAEHLNPKDFPPKKDLKKKQKEEKKEEKEEEELDKVEEESSEKASKSSKKAAKSSEKAAKSSGSSELPLPTSAVSESSLSSDSSSSVLNKRDEAAASSKSVATLNTESPETKASSSATETLPPSSSPSPTAATSTTAASGGEPESSAFSTKTKSKSKSEKPTPTVEWSREEVQDAKKYHGYTGGIIGELCDSYVKKLKKHIPLMVALMSAWLIIAIGGLIRVFVCLHRLKKQPPYTKQFD